MDIANTLKREVYRNLHFKPASEHFDRVYSVRKEGLVEGHALMIILDGTTKKPVKFAVGPKGNQRVRDEKRKNVHAVIRGHIVNAVWYNADMDAFELGHAKDACEHFKAQHMDAREGYKWMEVKYDPYKYDTFVTRDTNPFRGGIEDKIEPIYTARKVIVGPKVWAQVPVENDLN
jgi:hypothetical protein